MIELQPIFFIISLIISSIILQKFAGVFRRISIISAVYILLLTFHGVGPLLIYYGFTEPYFSPSISERLLPVLSLSYIFFAVGVMHCAMAMHYNWRRVSAPTDVGSETIRYLPLVLMVALICFVFLAHVHATGNLGVKHFFSHIGDPQEIVHFRIETVRQSPWLYLLVLSSGIFLPIITLLVMYDWLNKRGRLRFFLLVGSVALGLLISTNSLAKSPAILFLAMVILGAVRYISLMKFNKSLAPQWNIRLTYVMMAISIVCGIAFLSELTYDIPFSDALFRVFYRIFIVPSDCLNLYLLYYPDEIPFQGIWGIGLVNRFLGIEGYVPPHTVLYSYSSNKWGTANAMWSADMWADFGYPGVIVGSILAGLILMLLEAKYQPKKRFSSDIAMHCFLIFAGITIVITSLFTALWSKGLVLGPMFLWFLRLTGVIRRSRKYIAVG